MVVPDMFQDGGLMWYEERAAAKPTEAKSVKTDLRSAATNDSDPSLCVDNIWLTNQ